VPAKQHPPRQSVLEDELVKNRGKHVPPRNRPRRSSAASGLLRRLNLWPTTGWKSFFISHASVNGPCVSARRRMHHHPFDKD
jgi:hypothetical protein